MDIFKAEQNKHKDSYKQYKNITDFCISAT